jgi:hypothetical protein
MIGLKIIQLNTLRGNKRVVTVRSDSVIIQIHVTVHHAKYFAHELTKRCPSDSVEKLASALSNAQVALNPHQIEAALFAFR